MNEHATLYYLIAVALLGNTVNVGVSLWTAFRVSHSQPVRVAEEVRDEMRQLREHWGAFVTALNPDHITELVGRHQARFKAIERVQATQEQHLVEHDGAIVNLRQRVAQLEGQEG